MTSDQTHIGQTKTRTQRLDIILVKATLDILDHQTCLPDLRVPNHPDLDHHTNTRATTEASSVLPSLILGHTEEESTHLFFSSLFASMGCAFCPFCICDEEPDGVEDDADADEEAMIILSVQIQLALS